MCAHGLVRLERREGFHYDPMWFHGSIFSGVGPASHAAHPSPEWTFGPVTRRKKVHVVVSCRFIVPIIRGQLG